jgi:hypothetical protein
MTPVVESHVPDFVVHTGDPGEPEKSSVSKVPGTFTLITTVAIPLSYAPAVAMYVNESIPT